MSYIAGIYIYAKQDKDRVRALETRIRQRRIYKGNVLITYLARAHLVGRYKGKRLRQHRTRKILLR